MRNEEARKKAKEICELLQEGKLTRPQIANKVDCSVSMVYNIIRGRTHLDISQHYTWTMPYSPSLIKRPKLSDKTVHEICRLVEQNELNRQEIADTCNVSVTSVSNIINKNCRTDISDNYEFPKSDCDSMYDLIQELGGFEVSYCTFVSNLKENLALILRKVKNKRMVYFSDEEKRILRLILGVLMKDAQYGHENPEFDVRELFSPEEDD